MNNPEPPKGEEHNPDGLSASQVGEGWRLLRKGEVVDRDDEYWHRVDRGWRSVSITVGREVAGQTVRRRIGCAKCFGFGWLRIGDPGLRCDCTRIQPPKIIGHIKLNNGIRGPGFAEWDEPVYASAEQTRSDCPTCAGMNDLVAIQGKRIAELERELWLARREAQSNADTSAAALDTLRAQLAEAKRDGELIDEIESRCLTVRMAGAPIADTGDYSNWWEVIEHYMAKPNDRVIATAPEGKLRQALRDAMQPLPEPPKQ